jgi:putative cell wall-binding protein
MPALTTNSLRATPHFGRAWRLGLLIAVTVSFLTASMARVEAADAVVVERVAGADRYVTSALLSAATTDPGVPVVYVATGVVFPDGLVAAAAAGQAGGTMLLVKPDAIPPAIAKELTRLKPGRIVIAGGTAAISADVEAELANYAPAVTRFAGTNRYDTAALISRAAFPTGANIVYVTTGETFPDTMASVPAAATTNGPVLLVRSASIPAATADEIERLNPSQIVVVGGPAAISSSLDAKLAAITGASVERRYGPDRYATSAAISQATFAPLVPVVYIATGVNHPDGLGGAAAGAIEGGPLLLTKTDSLPASVATELQRLKPQRVVIVGGTTAITTNVQTHITQILTEATRPFVSWPILTQAPNTSTPLVTVVNATTTVPTKLTVAITDGSNSWVHESDDFTTDHEIPLLGFRPGRTHEIDIVATDTDGTSYETAPILTWTAPELPTGFPTMTVTGDSTAAEPGLTLFPVYRFTGTNKYVVAVDTAGDVVWYHETDEIFGDVRQLPSGNLLMVRDKDDIVEMDILGNVVREWHASNRSPAPSGSIPIDTDSIHHEVVPLASGNYLTLSSEVRTFESYLVDASHPNPPAEPAKVVGDVIVEFAANGDVVSETKLLDILDPFRIGWNALDVNYWDNYYSAKTVDWSHANAVISSGDGGFIVSLRHQDALVKIDGTGQLVWILGDPNGWGPAYAPYLLQPVGGAFSWPYHQHAPELTSVGTILLFDNHNGGAFPPDTQVADPRSRAVEYRINESSMTVQQVWEYAPGNLYASFIGDADELPTTGNVLVTFGGLRDEVDEQPSARLVEVTRDQSPTVVWELRVEDTNPDGAGNYFIYRAERIAGLVP